VEIWEQLAASRVVVAFEHLAKYYEHQKRDFGRALQCTRRLMERLMECAPHDHQHRQRDARLRTRLRR
jgi:hypothetical protein